MGSARPGAAWIVAVYSGKGGVGRTTVALNLAVALAQGRRSVALVDLDLQYGDVAAALDLPVAATTIADLVAVPADEVDLDLVRSALVPSAAGVEVLAAPSLPELADLAESHRGAVEAVIRVLSGAFEYVVIDLGRYMGETGAAVLETSDQVVLVTTALGLSLKDLRRSEQLLRRLGVPSDRMLFVLNRVEDHANFDRREVETTLARRLDAVLPHDARLAVGALDEGQPLLLKNPRSPLSVAIQQLAGEIASQARVSTSAVGARGAASAAS